MKDSVERIHKWFIENEKTLSLAESCTGGLISSQLTAMPGSSRYFIGSVVSYHRSVKQNQLGVSENLIKTLGEVSLPVARQMAQGARKYLNTDWSVSVTGIAGPGGGTPEKPVGTVCFAVCGPGIEQVHQERFKIEQREEIQLASAKFAIDFLWDSIKN